MKCTRHLEAFNWDDHGFVYEFNDLLERIEDIMNAKKESQDEEEKDQRGELPLTKMISTKTSIVNFQILCQQLEREPNHVLEFFKCEMDVEGNFGSEGNILLQGRHKAPIINGLYKKYVEQYVRC